VVNEPHLTETRESLGDETFENLRSRFVKEAKDLISWFTAQSATDLSEVAVRTHKVAGSAAIFGADRFRDALKSIETAAKQGDADFVIAVQQELISIWKLTETALETD
jgi:HPt (histidine-containing phosphotransfer) domain-containing protein